MFRFFEKFAFLNIYYNYEREVDTINYFIPKRDEGGDYMWYTCFSTSGRHYGFRAIGIDTRYHKGIFQILVRSLADLHRIMEVFQCEIVLHPNSVEIYDDWRE